MRSDVKWSENIKSLIDNGTELHISDLAQEVEKVANFDTDELIRKEARRIVTRRLRGSLFRDKNGDRKYFPVKGKDIIINIETCNDRTLVEIVKNYYDDMIEGDQRAYRKAKKRLRQIEGQMTLFSERASDSANAVSF